MKRVVLAACAVTILLPVRAHAFITDSAIAGIWYARDMAYQAFMKLKVVEEVRTLKENYDASVRYYDLFKRMNSGKGLVHNVADQLATAGKHVARDLEARINRDFVDTYNTDTDVDKFFRGIDMKINSSMRYAGDELANVISNLDAGAKIAGNANGLSPKDAANLSAKAGGLQLQMMVQLHEDNLRLIELQTMRLAVETRRERKRLEVLKSLEESVGSRLPGGAGAAAGSSSGVRGFSWEGQ